MHRTHGARKLRLQHCVRIMPQRCWLRFVMHIHGLDSYFFLATCGVHTLRHLGTLICLSLIAADYQNNPLFDVFVPLRRICVLDTRPGYSWQSKSCHPVPIPSPGATVPCDSLAGIVCSLKPHHHMSIVSFPLNDEI